MKFRTLHLLSSRQTFWDARGPFSEYGQLHKEKRGCPRGAVYSDCHRLANTTYSFLAWGTRPYEKEAY